MSTKLFIALGAIVLAAPAVAQVGTAPAGSPTVGPINPNGVVTAPGTTTDTPMRCLARSKRSTSESPRSPYLLAL